MTAPSGKPALLLHGMHGLGDCLYERAIARQYLQRGFDVWLESSWVSMFHDLIPLGLKVVRNSTALRTQRKNALRELAGFSRISPPSSLRKIRVWYCPKDVRQYGSVLGAMCKSTECDVEQADFRLPIPPVWRAKAQAWIDQWRPTKPIMIYRPLVDRTEWGGGSTRNPLPANYAKLFEAISERFFVVSVADLVPQKEWMVGKDVRVDVQCHAGELEFETLAALFSMSAMVFTSPGFAVPLAQAVGTPVACIFGGYQNSKSLSVGASYAPYLGIETIKQCDCFSNSHPCCKTIDMPPALKKIKQFADDASAGPAGVPEYDPAPSPQPRGKKVMKKILLLPGLGDVHWVFLKLQDWLRKRGPDWAMPEVSIWNIDNRPRTLEYFQFIPWIKTGGYFQLPIAGKDQQILNSVYMNSSSTDSVYDFHGYDAFIATNGSMRNGVPFSKILEGAAINYDYGPMLCDDDYGKSAKALGRYFVLCFSGFGMFAHDWCNHMPASAIRDMVAQLRGKFPQHDFIFTGCAWDDAFSSQCQTPADRQLVGQTTLPQLLSLLRHSDGYIGWAGGNSILAQHMGVPAAVWWSRRHFPKHDRLGWETPHRDRRHLVFEAEDYHRVKTPAAIANFLKDAARCRNAT